MPGRRFIHVIDPDDHRRAHIALKLVARDVHPKIYGAVDDFIDAAPAHGGVIMWHGPGGGNVSHLIEGLSKTGLSLPVVIYAENPPVSAVVEAMLQGACDYLTHLVEAPISTYCPLSEHLAQFAG